MVPDCIQRVGVRVGEGEAGGGGTRTRTGTARGHGQRARARLFFEPAPYVVRRHQSHESQREGARSPK